MVVLQKRPPLLHRTLRDDPANFTDIPDFFLAHELAHQWWGQGVAGQNYRERWLSEAFAQYAAALWVRKSRGEDEFQGVLERLQRWAFRYTAQGPINLGHRLGYLRSDPQIYRAIVYDKGAYVLHMLRALVGDDAFNRGLRSFQAAHRFGKAGTDDLREAFEAESRRDLTAYFREWVDGTTLPVLRYSHRTEPQSGGFRTTVDVRATGLPGPVPLLVTLEMDRASETQTITLPPEGGVFTFDMPAAPRKVTLNQDRALLARVER
jgi:aminopeptidase N